MEFLNLNTVQWAVLVFSLLILLTELPDPDPLYVGFVRNGGKLFFFAITVLSKTKITTVALIVGDFIIWFW